MFTPVKVIRTASTAETARYWRDLPGPKLKFRLALLASIKALADQNMSPVAIRKKR